MLLTEWNMDDAIAVAREEAWEDGHAEGRSENNKEVAINALAEGASPEFVQKITGLDLETIQKLKNSPDYSSINHNLR